MTGRIGGSVRGAMLLGASLAGAALPAACAFAPAALREPPLPVRAPLDAPTDGGPGSPAAWPTRTWWKQYADPTLDELVRMSLAAAPTLRVARSRFDFARESVREAGAAVGARVDLDGDANRQRLSDNGVFPPRLLGFNWYNQFDLGLQASYTFDWWGKQRDIVAAAVDSADAAQADRSAAELLLVSSIIDSYFGWQADQARLTLARMRLADAQKVLAIAEARSRAEIESADASNTARAALGEAREQLAGIDGSARLRIVAIAALVGKPVSALPAFEPKPLPALRGDIPDEVGIDLLARRADIAASLLRVEAARQSSAAARADFYPDLSVKALLGLSSLKIDRLLEIGSGVPSVTAAVHLPIFDAGRLQARLGASRAQLRAAIADYEQTLVAAAKDVATQAAMRQQLIAQRAQRALQLTAARSNLSAAAARAREGLTDLTPQLQADLNALAQADALAQLDGALLSADVGLQRALGGGYGSGESR